jgi:tetratricopeptide (TPR) repeat protein
VKNWKETYLPILEILNSLLMGFLTLYCFYSIHATVPESSGFFGNYSDLVALSAASFLLGYILHALFQKVPTPRTDGILAFLQILITVWFLLIFNRPFILETIFHLEEIQFLFILLFVCLGFQITSLKESQMGGFLLGSFIFVLIGFVVKYPTSHLKVFLLLLLLTGLCNLLFRQFLNVKNQFLPTRSRKKDFKLFKDLYSSYAILFILNLTFTSVRGFHLIQLSIFLFLVAFLSSRTLTIYRSQGAHHRQSFIIGRNFLVLNFIIFAASFSWQAFSWVLYFNLGVAFGYYKPDRPDQRKRITSIIYGLIAASLCLLILSLTKINIYFIHLEVLLVILVFLPLRTVHNMSPISHHFPILTAGILSIFLFQQPVIQNYHKPSKPIIQISEPIPYLLSNLLESNQPYIFIQTGLPWENRLDFPKLDELKGSIPVLGNNPSNAHLEYYRNYLEKQSISYILISFDKTAPIGNTVITKEFPGFKISHSPDVYKADWNSLLSRDWKTNYILEKLEGIPSYKDFAPVLDQMETYNSGDLKKEIQLFRSLIQLSILEYCTYYNETGLYAESLDCLELHLKFGKLDKKSKDIAYDSLNFTTPSVNHLNVLLELADEKLYRVSALKKIYPIYDSMNNPKEAIRILETLRSTLISENPNNIEIDECEQELARLHLETNDLDGAYYYISSGLRNQPDSILWHRLKVDLDSKRESKRKSWQPPPTINTKEI